MSILLLLLIPLAAIGLLAAGARWRFLALLAFVIMFQNLATMLLLKGGLIGIREGMLLLYIKEVILALALAFEFGRIVVTGRVAFDRTDVVCAAYLLYCTAHFLFMSGEIPLGFRIAGFRAIAILPCVYLLGRWLLRSRPERLSLRFGRFYLGAAVAIAAFGVVEFFVIPESFWIAVGQPEYYTMKVGFEAEPGELYGNMYASFGIFFLRRAASLIADPIMSTYFIVFGLTVISLIRPMAKGKWLLLAVGAGFCMGRSAILSYLAGMFEVLLERRKIVPFGYFSLGFLAIILVFPFLPILSTETLVTFLGSHYHGLVNALEAMKESPLGMGVGSASNLVASLLRAMGKEEGLAIGDTYIGSLVAQIGLPGMVLFLSFNLSLSRKLFAMSKLETGAEGWPLPAYYKATAVFILGVTVLSSINETGYGLTSAGLAFLLAGLLSTEFHQRRAGVGAPKPCGDIPT